MRIGIVGAGIMGRTLCAHLLNKSFEPILFEQNDLSAKNCSNVAAGLLSPYAESNGSTASLMTVGSCAISYWKNSSIVRDNNIFFDDHGTICIAHHQSELDHFKRCLLEKHYAEININEHESELEKQYIFGLHLPHEAQIDAQKLMAAFALLLQKKKKVIRATVQDIRINKIKADKDYPVDWVIDCRGLEAKDQFHDLRGVRGELMMVHAPFVNIKHVIRFFHPRYPIYIVPRSRNHYLIGASSIEAEDYSAITVRAILELLSTAYSIHKGFSDATLVDTGVHCRPAFNENLPRLYVDEENRIIKINGLYRHGYLFAPFFSIALEEFFNNQRWPSDVRPYLNKGKNADYFK